MATSLAEYFAQMDNYSKQMNVTTNRSERRYLTLSSKAASGSTAMFRLIPDVNNCPVRLIHDLYDVWLTTKAVNENGTPVLDSTGNETYNYSRYTICGLSNFHDATLSAEDRSLIENTYKLLEEYSNYVYNEMIDPDEMGISLTHRAEVSLWWGKLVNWRGKSELIDELGKVYLMRHHSKSFFQDYCKAINDKTQMKGTGAWMEQYMSRDTGVHEELCSITTELSQGYKTIVQFDTGAPYEVTQEDIDAATDLRTEIVNVVDFQRDRYQTVYNALKDVLEKFSNATADQIGVVPTATTQSVDVNVAYPDQNPKTYTPGPGPATSAATHAPVGFPPQGVPRSAGAPVPPMGPPTSL